jgi:hypothetical protein
LTTAYPFVFANILFRRPMLPFDNRSWGLSLGLGLNSSLASQTAIGINVSLSTVASFFSATYNGWPGAARLIIGADIGSGAPTTFLVGVSYDL